MAKLAQVAYGRTSAGVNGHGMKPDGTGYTYVVDDNVRKNYFLNVAARHYISGKYFGTTGKVIATASEGTRAADEIKGKLEEESAKTGEKIIIQDAKTNKELFGIERGAKGKFVSSGTYDEEGNYIPSEASKAARYANAKAAAEKSDGELADTERMRENYESYEDYMAKFSKGD